MKQEKYVSEIRGIEFTDDARLLSMQSDFLENGNVLTIQDWKSYVCDSTFRYAITEVLTDEEHSNLVTSFQMRRQ